MPKNDKKVVHLTNPWSQLSHVEVLVCSVESSVAMPVLRSGKQVRESTSENVLNQLRKKSNQERRIIRGKSID